MKRKIAALLVVVVPTVTLALARQTRSSQQPIPARKPNYKGSVDNIQRSLDEEMARERIRSERYQGISVSPRKDVQGEVRALHQSIADRMNRLDFVPQERLIHFAWFFDLYPYLKPVGWHGTILDADSGPSGLRFKVQVSVKHSSGASVYTDDHMIEFYELSGDRLSFIRAEYPISQPGTAHF